MIGLIQTGAFPNENEITESYFYRVYDLAVQQVRDPEDVNRMRYAAFNPNVEFRGTRPIKLLATEGNHQAVSFLLDLGCGPQYAIEGYIDAGHFKDEASAKALLERFTKDEDRASLAQAAVEAGCTSYNMPYLAESRPSMRM